MIILFIGDPHLKISRFETVKEFLGWTIKIIDQEKPDLVVNLGDTFDTHAVVRSEIMGEFRQHISQVVERCPYLYLLGNHDMFKPNNSKYHALQTLKNIDGFTVIDEIIHDKVRGISWIPYQIKPDLFPQDTLPICVAHQTFMGADFGFYRPEDGVDADKVSAEVIVSGHIHKRQVFGKVIYPGTPYAQGIDDINQSKGLMWFDTDTYEYGFIESPFAKWRGLRFEVGDLSVDQIHSILCQDINDKDQWVVEITGPRAEINGYIDSKQLKTLREGKMLRIKPSYTDSNKREGTKIKAITPTNIVDEYVDKIYSGSLDKGRIKTMAHEILSKVK